MSPLVVTPGCHPSLSPLVVTLTGFLPWNILLSMRRADRETKEEKAAGTAAGSYESFMALLDERIPDELLVDQLERELRLGGEAPDLREMAIRQRARQDIEAHKGYRRADRQEQQDRKGGLVVRIVKFAGDKHGGR